MVGLRKTFLACAAGIAATALCTSSAKADLTSDLVAYWNLNTHADDIAGAIPGNASTVADNGTLVNAPSVGFSTTDPSPLGGGHALFDGETGFIDAGRSVDTSIVAQDLTISAWFRVDAYDTAWQSLIVHGEASDYRIARNDSTTGLAYAGGVGDIRGTVPVVTNGWHHALAVTTHGVGTELFLDGVSIGTQLNAATSITDEGGNLYIGANSQRAGREWEGAIDDVALWTRALDSAEIAEIYNGGLNGMSLAQLTIPEPSSMALFLIGSVALIRLRRR